MNYEEVCYHLFTLLRAVEDECANGRIEQARYTAMQRHKHLSKEEYYRLLDLYSPLNDPEKLKSVVTWLRSFEEETV